MVIFFSFLFSFFFVCFFFCFLFFSFFFVCPFILYFLISLFGCGFCYLFWFCLQIVCQARNSCVICARSLSLSLSLALFGDLCISWFHVVSVLCDTAPTKTRTCQVQVIFLLYFACREEILQWGVGPGPGRLFFRLFFFCIWKGFFFFFFAKDVWHVHVHPSACLGPTVLERPAAVATWGLKSRWDSPRRICPPPPIPPPPPSFFWFFFFGVLVFLIFYFSLSGFALLSVLSAELALDLHCPKPSSVAWKKDIVSLSSLCPPSFSRVVLFPFH